jgi:peptidyl-prolyl cis-trans isomerase D
MITWLQTTFGKHHKKMMWLLLVIVIVAFVFTIGSVPRGGTGGGGGPAQVLFGVNLSDPQTSQNLQQAVQLTRAWEGQTLRTAQELQQAMLERITILHLADAWNIPDPGPNDIQLYLRAIPAFHDKSGNFDPDLYQRFRDEVDAATPEQRDLISQTLLDNWRILRVRHALAGPGYALPFQAKIQAGLFTTSWDIDVASLDYAKFQAKIQPTDAELLKLFNRDPTRYQIPAQTLLSYVRFTVPFVTAKPTTDQMRDYVLSNPDLFPTVDVNNIDDKSGNITAAWQKAQQAPLLRKAEQQASDFVRELYELDTPSGSPAYAALLKKYNLTPQPLAPFVAGQPAPDDSPVLDNVLQQAAPTLSATHYFSDPVRTDEGPVVLFFDQAVPARTPTFAEARAAVLAEYTDQEKARQFDAYGTDLRKQLTQAVAAGKNFPDAAKALGLTITHFTQLTYSPTAPTGMSIELFSALFEPAGGGLPYLLTLDPGQVTHMLTTSDVGAFVYIDNRVTPALNPDSPQLEAVYRVIARQEAQINEAYVISKWLHDGLQASKLSAPAAAPSS